METPRTPRSAQPEINFAGSPDAPGSHDVSDPTVNAAFIAFHRNSARLAAPRPVKRHMNRGAIALAALTLIGFGGGLSLAFFAFNSPEKSGGAVASRGPEIIYMAPAAAEPPAKADAAPLYDVSGEVGLFASSAFGLRAEDDPIPETSVWRDTSQRGAFPFSGSFSDDGAPALALSAEQGFAGEPLSVATAGEITSGFGALTAAAVPEPSTWASMLAGAALLLVLRRRTTSRRS